MRTCPGCGAPVMDDPTCSYCARPQERAPTIAYRPMMHATFCSTSPGLSVLGSTSAFYPGYVTYVEDRIEKVFAWCETPTKGRA